MSHLRAQTVLVIQSHGTNRVGSIDKGERNLDFRARTYLRGGLRRLIDRQNQDRNRTADTSLESVQ